MGPYSRLAGFTTGALSPASPNISCHPATELAIRLQRYRALVDAIDQAFMLCEMIWDEQGNPVDYRFLEVNQAFGVMTGVAAEQAVGRRMRELVSTEDADWWVATYGRVVRSRQETRFQNTIPTLGRWYDSFAMPDEGNRFVVLFTDITERMQAERALREGEERLCAVANLVPDLLWSKDSDGATEWCNERWLEYTGQSREQALGFGCHDAIHPDETPRLLARFAEVLQSGEEFRHQCRLRRHDGVYRWFLLGMSPFRDSSGRILRWYGTATDIHEQRMAVDALAERQALLELALDAGGLGTWSLDPTAQMFTASRLVQEIFHSPGDCYSTDLWRSTIHPEDRERVEAEMRATLAGERPFCVEFRTVTEPHRSRWVRSQARLCQSPAGTRRIIGVTEDITDRKAAEVALKRSNENLEQFAYMASHDLKEPLRMISGFADLLATRTRSSLDAKSSRYLEFLLGGARRMQCIVDDLLAFARVVGDQSSPFVLVDCNLALQTALASLRHSIEESEARITSDPLPSVSGQDSLLAQVFQNLLSNSMHYRKASEPPRIHISAARKEQQWVIAVSDNGVGFDPKEAERIFGAFIRLQGRDQSGSGMGLTLCRRIVEHHHGKIWAESEPGVGSTFFISLPVPELPPPM